MSHKELQKYWERCLNYLKTNVSEQDYERWFRGLVPISFNEATHELILRGPSRYYCEHINKHFKETLYAIAFTVFNSKEIWITFNYFVDEEKNVSTNDKIYPAPVELKVNQRTKHVQQIEDTFDSRLKENYTFETFIEGESNKCLRSVGMAIANSANGQIAFNPLFIYGNSGVGKTHLMHAIGARYKRNHPNKRVLAVSAHEFKMQYTNAVRNEKNNVSTGTINDFILFYQTIDLLLIDDVQELAGNKGTLNALFNIFQHLKMNNKLIVFTCDRPPATLSGIEDRLISRFAWGLTEELGQPNQELRRRILESKVRQDSLNIPEDVITYLSSYVNCNVRELEGLLNSLIAHSVAFNRNIDLAFARQIVHRNLHTQHSPITMEEVIEVVCEKCKVTQSDLISKSRCMPLALYRQITMYLAQKYTKMTAVKIGLYLGQRTHATVTYAITKVAESIESDKNVAKLVQEIEVALKR
ncbi:MAG: chromosomal replication initiator protein DnaA [Bacteroidaceae bacterium]|nr:chromosomal replication initiator protein DnaA [Bacteroidaceae bacterium]